jgi:hypothetical protein
VGRNVDGVDGVVLDEPGVASVRGPDAEAISEPARLLLRARADGGDGPAVRLQVLDEGAGDPAGAEDAPPQPCRHEEER